MLKGKMGWASAIKTVLFVFTMVLIVGAISITAFFLFSGEKSIISESEAESIVLKEIESVGGGEVISTKFYENYPEGFNNGSLKNIYTVRVELKNPTPSKLLKGLDEKYRHYILLENGEVISYSPSSYRGTE